MYQGAKTLVMTLVRVVGGDLARFPVVMRLHQGSTLSPMLFALVIKMNGHDIQGEVPWCTSFAYDISLIAETCGVEVKLEVWRQDSRV